MNKINTTYSDKYYQPPKEEGLINKSLNSDVFRRILSILEDGSMQSAVNVNRLWKKDVIETAKFKKSSEFIKFKQFLDTYLKVKSYEINKNHFELKIIKINECENLKDVNIIKKQLEKDVYNYLVDHLSEKEFQYLEEFAKGKKSVEKIFDLLKMIKIIKNDCFDLEKVDSFRNELRELKNVDWDVILLKNILSEEVYQFTLIFFIGVVAKRDLEKALKLTETITRETSKYSAFAEISQTLADKGDFDKALEVVDRIPKSIVHKKSDTLAYISQRLQEQRDFERALEIAKKIPDFFLRNLWVERVKASLN